MFTENYRNPLYFYILQIVGNPKMFECNRINKNRNLTLVCNVTKFYIKFYLQFYHFNYFLFC